ncbi:hypothetical protein [Methylomonas sp. AM2-LC]|uniref:hypothetical protein n=1 Tax=Methylomonas sp. AM2-LC TaxID=3153301 RepID=UPI0032641374
MSNIKILIVVDGIFNLTTTYPANFTDANYGPDAWFTLSHLILTLRGAGFVVDTASRGFNVAGNFDNEALVNSVADPAATLKGPDPSNPTPFRFDDPSVDLHFYDELWLFGFEGVDGTGFRVGPGAMTAEPGALTDSELAAITAFMQAGGGIFATGDHDGLGSALCGRIPRVRYMRKWYSSGDSYPGRPPLAVDNWSGGGSGRIDTLQHGVGDSTDSSGNLHFFFDNQSDDIPQPLYALIPSHPAMQGASGVLTIFPDHMHEGEVIAASGDQLKQTSASDTTLAFAGAGFTEFPSISGYREPPKVLAQVATGTPGAGGTLVGHVTDIGEGGPTPNCENKNFSSDGTVCQAIPFVHNVSGVNALAAYDGATMNVGRIVTDSSFHHYLDLNLLGDPCSIDVAKQSGFKGTPHLAELDAFYVNLANWLAWKERNFYFVFGKNNYGRDEVNDSLDYPTAFYVFLEGYTPNLLAGAKPVFVGSFSSINIPGLTITGPIITYDVGNSGSNANVTQRIRFEYAVHFTASSLGVFPAQGSPPKAFSLEANILIQGKSIPTQTAEFFLLGGDDPYFANVNANAGNPFYLSQDLRVFTITPTANGQTPIGTVPFNFTSGDPTTLDTAAGYHYIQDLVDYFNNQIGYKNSSYVPPDTNATDPLDGLLPAQFGALLGDSTVTPFTGSNVNYNFAIARVRLKGASGPGAAAKNVKVFFRAFTTQTFDTDYINTPTVISGSDPQLTYPSTGADNDPQSPLPGSFNGVINGCSLPFFVTRNFVDGPSDYDAAGPNNLTIEIPGGQDYTWAFFGCFLNVNDPNNQYGGQPVQHWFAGSAHNCLVAQIAYSDAPIVNANGVIANPEISDKLAQRNLQVTTSGNPGFPATHKVPQTIDLRPSPPALSTARFGISSYPDEIMIDWGNTPIGSIARIYWPAVKMEKVLSLSARLYSAHNLIAEDANTLRFEVTGPVTYIPIPEGRGDGFPGLLTVDLPATVRVGNAFDITLRRITTRRFGQDIKLNRDSVTRLAELSTAAPLWRYVTGSFHMTIPVTQESIILPDDENLLAILKWRLGLIGPGNRWYPVLLRYIAVISDRINGMGGNAATIPPSSNGFQPPSKCGVHHHHEHCYTGKIIDVRYDRFGDFDGFTLVSEQGHEHRFRGREREVEDIVVRAWIERSTISVVVEVNNPDWPASFVLHRQN